MTREDLINSLRTSVLEIHFTTLSGEAKVVTGTLHESSIPDNHKPKTEKNPSAVRDAALQTDLTIPKSSPAKDQNVTLFAIDRDGWRAIRIDRISHVVTKEVFQ